ncbi:hypothetical protein O181_095905 [Austropuccinia psidii MF-1]|uniref:Uncharacterized protein n=1 Tax=Austropuccinia psidii MF-1 TaxID=1389203 RepID=A0A9Q3PCI4_9BASI|nr:hypothetical protein [Austropuccinia psidii MF-1]
MDQSTSKLPPLTEETVEGNYEQESEEEDQSEYPMRIFKETQEQMAQNPSEPSLPRHVRAEESPISPTPGPRETSTPATESRPSNIPRRDFVSTPTHPSPLKQEIPRKERSVLNIKAMNYNLNFHGEEAEKCIKKTERIAQIEGATEEDLAMQIAFWTTDSKISDTIEPMPGYEEGNWTWLKNALIKTWGRVEPERRYRKDPHVQLFNDTQDEGGISNLSQDKRFIGEYETIITYLLRYKYIPQDNMFHEDIFDCLSSEIKGAISKEMIKENVMVRAEDGGYLIPPMKILKKYIEQALEARVLVTKRLSPPRIAEKKESKNKERTVQFKEEVFPGMQEALKKMKELTRTLKEQKEVVKEEAPAENEDVKKFMDQLNELTNVAKPQKKIINNPQSNNQGFRPRDNFSPPPNRSVPYIPAQNVPKFAATCYYFRKKVIQLEDVLS